MASACTLKLVTTRALVLALLYLLVLQGVCGPSLSLFFSFFTLAYLSFRLDFRMSISLSFWCFRLWNFLTGCVSGHGCFHEKPAQNRKILHADLKENNGSITGAGNMENFVGWELRAVPSGPDPLHHNGGSPKKPRTDP
ncbi:hypothetical protein Goarm_014495 [Gossypium armourianum]|uniref:Uncharacterized protein n=2 Tax=Gossypium TaxID=3633 RepID=A0A7J9J6C1_9ROSI|nr:hypothetical protein [Gossypium armourianum]